MPLDGDVNALLVMVGALAVIISSSVGQCGRLLSSGHLMMQGIKEARERAMREEDLIRQYEAEETARLAAAAAAKKIKIASAKAEIEQV